MLLTDSISNILMKNISYYYYVMILRDGTQLPWIKIHSAGEASILEKMSILEMRKSKNVKDLIGKIVNATEVFYFHHFTLTLEIGETTTKIFEDVAESLPFSISTSELLEILIGWAEFLAAYEKGEIPGISLQGKG